MWACWLVVGSTSKVQVVREIDLAILELMRHSLVDVRQSVRLVRQSASETPQTRTKTRTNNSPTDSPARNADRAGRAAAVSHVAVAT